MPAAEALAVEPIEEDGQPNCEGGEIEEAFDGPFVETLGAGTLGGLEKIRLVGAGEEGEEGNAEMPVLPDIDEEGNAKLAEAGERPEELAGALFPQNYGNAADSALGVTLAVAEVAEKHIEEEVDPSPREENLAISEDDEETPGMRVMMEPLLDRSAAIEVQGEDGNGNDGGSEEAFDEREVFPSEAEDGDRVTEGDDRSTEDAGKGSPVAAPGGKADEDEGGEDEGDGAGGAQAGTGGGADGEVDGVGGIAAEAVGVVDEEGGAEPEGEPVRGGDVEEPAHGPAKGGDAGRAVKAEGVNDGFYFREE